VTTTERPRRTRGTAIGEGLTWAARWSLRLILVSAGAYLIWTLIGLLWSVIFPTILAVIISTVLWPIAAWLRRHRFPSVLAAATVMLTGVIVLAGVIALIATSVAGSIPEITRSASNGLTAIQQWLAGPQVDFARGELDAVLQNITTELQNSLATITTSVLAGVGSVASGVITALLTLVLVFLFLKDGQRFLPWLRSVSGEGAGVHLAEVLRRIWKTISDFIRVQAIVALVDSVLIGLALVILGVPLAVPLAVITFIGAFIPIVGAIVAGTLGVLVALVSNGFTTALILLGVIIAVQQLEGNVMQPILQGRSLRLHASVVLLAVTAGGTLFGIAGAFLSVPVAAAGAVVLRYLSERIDARANGDAPPPMVDPPLETVQTVTAVPNAPSPDGSVPASPSEPAGPATRTEDEVRDGGAIPDRTDDGGPDVTDRDDRRP
jgi:putative heme transporter